MKTLQQRKKKQGRVNIGQKAIPASSPSIARHVKDNLGTPVCVVLKNGSLYYGVLNQIQGDKVILQGFKGNRRFSRNKANAKAQISNLGGLGGLLGGGGGGLGGMLGGGGGGLGGMLGLLGGGGLGGLLGGGSSGLMGGLGKVGASKGTTGAGGFLGNMGSFFKLGMGVISFIMPLMKNFSI
ncbi:hypothetical protein GCM10008018_44850 [Paenibacillus marchantiophytorum]|uniref:Uncharacterized protein n=1 Tax=Paenibacillus marchantiophytorum TaxID=1619310 RepID=A0ABQ1EZF9_9BACL|nr:hypothetical protein [Paenibacillus marchantiophytorum]GFZ93446.1 hypothetical protein GCM10008018_44850 [Paenibacillus marchantiophytorum]